MAIQVTITVTKTDDKPWVFTYTEPDAALRGVEQAKGWLCSEWDLPSNQQAVLVKTFPNMIEANKFIIKNIDTDYPDYETISDLFAVYSNKDEQITTTEV